MAEGHTLHALATRFTAAFAGERVAASSPQGAFADGAARLDGAVVREAQAYGKHLLVTVDGAAPAPGPDGGTVAGEGVTAHLHVHLGMAGRFSVRRHRRVVRDGRLLSEPPVRGAVRLRLLTLAHLGDLTAPTVCELLDDAGVAALTGRLGPDPLRDDHDPDAAVAALARSRRPIGLLLVDQAVVAGIGNVYRAELLHRAGIHPDTAGADVGRDRLERLWQDACRLMAVGAGAGWIVTDDGQVAAAREYLERGERVPRWVKRYAVYGRAGRGCGRCGTSVETARQGRQRIFWCPRCQPGDAGSGR